MISINKTVKSSINMAYILSHPNQIELLEGFSEKYGIHFVPLDKSRVEENLPLLRVTKSQLILEQQGQSFFFHPSMSLLRMINIMRGKGDRFLEAVNIGEGDIFLDATMGLASDALIASWAVGDTGKVIALEASPFIHVLVQDGLKRLENMKPRAMGNTEKGEAWDKLTKASARIETIYQEHTHFLRNLPDTSIDIVYFDPMFRETVTTSSSIKPLKNWSHPEAITIDTLKQAYRVARKRIVLKEKRNSGEFERLGFKIVEASKYNPICFGTIELT